MKRHLSFLKEVHQARLNGSSRSSSTVRACVASLVFVASRNQLRAATTRTILHP